MKEVQKGEKAAEAKSRRIDKAITAKLTAAAKKAMSAGKQLLQEERDAYEQRRVIQAVKFRRSACCGELNGIIAGLGA